MESSTTFGAIESSTTLDPNNFTQQYILRKSQKDANDVVWVLTSSFLIFTMQSGYGLLESGLVSRKNEVNILIKNATNVLLGGLGYWLFGYSISFGRISYPLIATGDYCTQARSEEEMGIVYSKYVFQFAYATTSSTFISGAMAERCKFTAYCLFAIFNIFVYAVPSGWMWRENGYLRSLGSVDIGGSGIVHLVGGCCGLMGSIILGPRTGRYDKGNDPLPLGNPTNALLGLFMLWWGWLGFSAGCTFGIVDDKWKYSSRAAVTTIMASMGGGFVGMAFSFITKKGLHDVNLLVDAVIASLVAVSGGAPIFRPWEAILVGCLAALFVLLVIPIVDWAHIDDSTNCFAVHGVGGLWGLLAIGLFPEQDYMLDYTRGRSGLFMGGGWKLLAAQAAGAGILILWSILTSSILLIFLKYTIGIRMTLEEEILGPDYVDHALKHDGNARVIEAVEKRSKFVRKRQGLIILVKENVKLNLRRKKVGDIIMGRNVFTH